MAIVNLQDLQVTFGAKTAVSAASFRVDAGETFSLIGASGCGFFNDTATTEIYTELLVGSVSPSLNASNKAEKPDNAPRANLSREEQKRLKREQAERRNALHKELKPLQQKYAALEGELEKAMNEQSDVETQLADPAVYADGARSTELLKRFNELRDLTERLMEDMAALEEQIAAIEARRADIDSMGDLA